MCRHEYIETHVCSNCVLSNNKRSEITIGIPSLSTCTIPDEVFMIHTGLSQFTAHQNITITP